MNEIPTAELKAQHFFTNYAFLDGSYVLLSPETPVTQELINRLAKWEFRTVKSNGKPVDSPLQAAAAVPGADSAAQKDGGQVIEVSEAEPDGEKLKGIAAAYKEYSDYIDALYTHFVTSKQINIKELMDREKTIYALIAENKRLVIRAQGIVEPNKNYLVSHAVNTSVLSIILGLSLRLPPFRLIELGAAAALHEIGMVRLPPQLYMANRQLTEQEKKSITTHTLIGYNILKDMQAPLAISLTALEHHERMNGSGYPRGIPGDKISLYSRIIMVACTYDAVTSSRPYKEAQNGYTGMVNILKNEGKQYDEMVIRALVYSLSIYPIGSQVMLTNKQPALVIDVDSQNPRYPIVQVLGTRTPDGKEIIIHTTEAGVHILRPLTREEISAMPNKGS